MPYKVGKKTKTKGWPILKNENGKWKVIAHSSSKEKAEASIRARPTCSPENDGLFE